MKKGIDGAKSEWVMAGAAGPRQGAHNEDERLAVEQTNQTIQRNKMNLICLVVAWRGARRVVCGLAFFLVG